MVVRRRPGVIRDAIITCLGAMPDDASAADIHQAVCRHLGETVPESSVRSYLRLNTPTLFTRTGHGRYKLRGR